MRAVLLSGLNLTLYRGHQCVITLQSVQNHDIRWHPQKTSPHPQKGANKTLVFHSDRVLLFQPIILQHVINEVICNVI